MGAILSFLTYSPIPIVVIALIYLLSFLDWSDIFKSRNTVDLSNYAEMDITSFPNRPRQLDGRRWSNFREIKKNNENLVKDSCLWLDKFVISPTVPQEFYDYATGEIKRQKLVLPRVGLNQVETTLTQMIIGKTGCGKTVTIEDYMMQNRHDWISPTLFGGEFKIWARELIIDYKGTFSAKFYREGKDIIFNCYDARSQSWDIWTELEYHPTVISAFLKGIVTNKNGDGDKAKFFTGTASKVLEEKAFRVAIKYKKLTPFEKWSLFVEDVEAWIEEESNPQGNESLAKTLSLCVPPLKLLCYQSSIAKRFFTFEMDYFGKTGVTLYLGNNEKYKTDLDSIVAGFIDSAQLIHLGRAETGDDYSLYALEEGKRLNLLNLNSLFTGGRGRRACIILIIQYNDFHKQDEINLLLSSVETLMIFTIGDKEADHLSKLLGEVKYIEENISTSHSSSESGASSSTSFSKAEKKELFINSSMLQQIPRNSHITIVKGRNLAYMGKSNYVKLDEPNKEIDEIELNDLNLFKFFKEEWEVRKTLGEETLSAVKEHINQIKDDSNLTDAEKKNMIDELLGEIEIPKKIDKYVVFDI